ncbi:MAG: hypothetical protein KGJ41_09695 [Rhodospirillales bacterium]|nr:hypothetical protein [Rhodospirillales bacterium]
MQRGNGTWMAFLAITFAVVGLLGVFATYAVPLPLERALAREATLDDALAALHGPNPAAALEALRPRLGSSAAALLPPGDDMPARIAAERVAMRRHFHIEAAAEATRMRWLISIMTVVCGVLGVGMLAISGRGR